MRNSPVESCDTSIGKSEDFSLVGKYPLLLVRVFVSDFPNSQGLEMSIREEEIRLEELMNSTAYTGVELSLLNYLISER